jgi:hypothetical protein
VSPPAVPANLAVPADKTAFLIGHAYGTQNYSCLPSGKSVAWTLYGPQATLFDDAAAQLITHFPQPESDENGTPRATWQHSKDTSSVWAVATATSSDAGLCRAGRDSVAAAGGRRRAVWTAGGRPLDRDHRTFIE